MGRSKILTNRLFSWDALYSGYLWGVLAPHVSSMPSHKHEAQTCSKVVWNKSQADALGDGCIFHLSVTHIHHSEHAPEGE